MKMRKRGEALTLDWIKSKCIVDEATGCWNWQRSRNKWGYGKIKWLGHTVSTHHMSFQLNGGIIPLGLCVLHECDNRSCCNPYHLSVGTQFANIQDMHAKGRAALGEQHGMAKLTVEKVRLIRSGLGNQLEKAKEFGVTQAAISAVMLGKTWAHVTA